MDHYNNDRKLKKRFLEAERTRDAARRKRSYEEFGKTKNPTREAATHVWNEAHQVDRLLKQTALRQAIRVVKQKQKTGELQSNTELKIIHEEVGISNTRSRILVHEHAQIKANDPTRYHKRNQAV